MKHYPQPQVDWSTGKLTPKCANCSGAIQLASGPGSWVHSAHVAYRKEQEALKQSNKKSTKN